MAKKLSEIRSEHLSSLDEANVKTKNKRRMDARLSKAKSAPTETPKSDPFASKKASLVDKVRAKAQKASSPEADHFASKKASMIDRVASRAGKSSSEPVSTPTPKSDPFASKKASLVSKVKAKATTPTPETSTEKPKAKATGGYDHADAMARLAKHKAKEGEPKPTRPTKDLSSVYVSRYDKTPSPTPKDVVNKSQKRADFGLDPEKPKGVFGKLKSFLKKKSMNQ